jgi:hypothetical protein
VLYICRPQQLEDAPPLLFEGVSRTAPEVCHRAASIHWHPG